MFVIVKISKGEKLFCSFLYKFSAFAFYSKSSFFLKRNVPRHEENYISLSVRTKFLSCQENITVISLTLGICSKIYAGCLRLWEILSKPYGVCSQYVFSCMFLPVLMFNLQMRHRDKIECLYKCSDIALPILLLLLLKHCEVRRDCLNGRLVMITTFHFVYNQDSHQVPRGLVSYIVEACQTKGWLIPGSSRVGQST